MQITYSHRGEAVLHKHKQVKCKKSSKQVKQSEIRKKTFNTLRIFLLKIVDHVLISSPRPLVVSKTSHQ